MHRRVIVASAAGNPVDTRCVLDWDDKQRKNRVRNADDATGVRYNYPPYHICVALMLPMQTRKEQNWGDGLPILRTEQYSVVDILCASTTLNDDGTSVTIIPNTLRIQNQYSQDDISIPDRFAQVETVWANKDRLEPDLASLITRHERIVRAGGAIAAERNLVAQIQQLTAQQSVDFPDIAGASAVGDPLPTLLQMIAAPPPAEPAVPIDDVPTEHTEIRRREIKKLRMAASRGPEAARFRRAVREAYDYRCLFCGIRLPQVVPGGNPGVDAAHTLPYSDFDVDHVSNGVCACKLHHWAYDEGLIEIRCEAGVYSIAIPDEAVPLAAARGVDLSFLRAICGPIPVTRLPKVAANRPKPEFLQKLHELFYPLG